MTSTKRPPAPAARRIRPLPSYVAEPATAPARKSPPPPPPVDLRVQYVHTARVRLVGTCGGERVARDYGHTAKVVRSLEELVALRGQFLGDAAFAFDPPLDTLLKQRALASVMPAKGKRGRKPKKPKEEGSENANDKGRVPQEVRGTDDWDSDDGEGEEF